MSEAPSHVDLVVLARAVRRAAVDGDVRGVHVELARLRNAVVHHLNAEQDELSELREAMADVAHHGQQRLLGLLDDLLFSTEDDDGSCNCLVSAAEVELMLRRQAKLEAALTALPPEGTTMPARQPAGATGRATHP